MWLKFGKNGLDHVVLVRFTGLDKMLSSSGCGLTPIVMMWFGLGWIGFGQQDFARLGSCLGFKSDNVGRVRSSLDRILSVLSWFHTQNMIMLFRSGFDRIFSGSGWTEFQNLMWIGLGLDRMLSGLGWIQNMMWCRSGSD